MPIGHNDAVLQVNKLRFCNIHYAITRILHMYPSYHVFYPALFYFERGGYIPIRENTKAFFILLEVAVDAWEGGLCSIEVANHAFY